MEVWKQHIQMTGLTRLELPVEARILSCQIQHTGPCIWALVDPKAPRQDVMFYSALTGEHLAFSMAEWVYLDTLLFHGGAFVTHVFYRKVS